MKAMRKTYGSEAPRVFYASRNAGRITSVDKPKHVSRRDPVKVPVYRSQSKKPWLIVFACAVAFVVLSRPDKMKTEVS
jgi:hypothetical protein